MISLIPSPMNPWKKPLSPMILCYFITYHLQALRIAFFNGARTIMMLLKTSSRLTMHDTLIGKSREEKGIQT